MAKPVKAAEYLKVRIETARPQELLLLLFDGAIRFATQAKHYTERKKFQEKNHLLLRSQEIILELIQALDRSIGDQVYSRLIGLYRFCYERLLRANITNQVELIDEALRILSHLRETWRLAIERAASENALGAEEPPKQALCLEG